MSNTPLRVLVTGASRGIGRAIAERLAQDGFFVLGSATTENGAAAISAYLGENGRGLALDVSDASSIDTVMKAIGDEFGTPHVLVNNAGITRDNLLMRMKDDEWDDIISTNLTSVFRMSKAVLRGMMKAKTGRIINISSVVGSTGNAGQANYAAAKAGMIGLTKSVAKELGSRNIRCNAIAPGFIETEMTESLSEEVRAEWVKGIPLKRGGKPEDVANCVLFLASDASAYISGQTINVCGGMVM